MNQQKDKAQSLGLELAVHLSNLYEALEKFQSSKGGESEELLVHIWRLCGLVQASIMARENFIRELAEHLEDRKSLIPTHHRAKHS